MRKYFLSRTVLFSFLFLVILVFSLNSFVIADNGTNGTVPPGTAGVYLPLVSNSVPTLTPTATPLTEGVTVKSSRGFTRPGSKFFRVAGEVMNKTTSNAYRIKISANFFDAAHKLIDSDVTDTYLGMVAPQHVAPFELLASKDIGSIVSYESTVSFLDHDSVDYRTLTVLSHQVRNNSGIEVFGEIRNDLDATVHAAALALTFYDASGKVSEAYPGFVDVDLSKGQATAYSISTSDSFSYASFIVQAQGYVRP